MANNTQANTSVTLQPAQIATWQGSGSVVLASRRTRPLWFDGRFLAARDLERDQNYFLQRQADLGAAAGFGVIHGLMVDRVLSDGGVPDAETIIIRAGQGLTPDGELVMISTDLTVRLSDLADEENLDVQFGVSGAPAPVARTRTGLYVIALRPVQFTANPITAYPASIQGSKTTRDGDVVEATAVSLVPYPDPASNYDATTRQAALARQIFVTATSGPLSDSLLPLAMISIQRGAIEWVDPWLVRRDSGPEQSGLRFGLADPATQQAFLLQYDAQLQQAVDPFVQQKLPARFAATDYFQALPPAGRFPLGSIGVDNFTQLFFPPQMDVLLSLIPDDELPALIEDSLSLPPFDLTLPATAYSDLAVFALVPAPRLGFAALAAGLPAVELTSALPQVLSPRKAIDLLQFYPAGPPKTTGSSADSTAWQNAIGSQTYGYYIRRRSSPVFAPLVKTPTIITLGAISTAVRVVLTATVSPATATGTVTFNGGSLGTAALTGGIAILVIAPGTPSVTATYTGDSTFAPSTSPVLRLPLGPPSS